MKKNKVWDYVFDNEYPYSICDFVWKIFGCIGAHIMIMVFGVLGLIALISIPVTLYQLCVSSATHNWHVFHILFNNSNTTTVYEELLVVGVITTSVSIIMLFWCLINWMYCKLKWNKKFECKFIDWKD